MLPGSARHFVADDATAREAAAAYVRHLHRSPARWATYALYVVGYAALAALLGAATSLSRAGVVVVWLVATAVAVVVMNTWAYLAVRRLTRSAFAAGATFESSWDDEDFWISGPTGEGRVPWTAVRSAGSTGDWVMLRQTNASGLCLYPRILLPEDVAERIALVGTSARSQTHDSP